MLDEMTLRNAWKNKLIWSKKKWKNLHGLGFHISKISIVWEIFVVIYHKAISSRMNFWRVNFYIKRSNCNKQQLVHNVINCQSNQSLYEFEFILLNKKKGITGKLFSSDDHIVISMFPK